MRVVWREIICWLIRFHWDIHLKWQMVSESTICYMVNLVCCTFDKVRSIVGIRYFQINYPNCSYLTISRVDFESQWKMGKLNLLYKRRRQDDQPSESTQQISNRVSRCWNFPRFELYFVQVEQMCLHSWWKQFVFLLCRWNYYSWFEDIVIAQNTFPASFIISTHAWVRQPEFADFVEYFIPCVFFWICIYFID